jgi:manganese/zinc/iron transport system permease protein
MALGAAVLGVLTAVLTQSIHAFAKVPEDASMGVVFTSLFAVGVILISRVAPQVDLDPGCVLYGSIELAPSDTVAVLGGFEVPRALQTLGPALVLSVVFIALLWKELKIVSFDPALAAAMGLPVTLIHYLLMAMVAGATVAAFEAVGSILVIAMLIVPGATAHLLTDRLAWMMVWSSVVAILSAIVGYLAAVQFDTNVAGMMSVAAGVFFALAVLFAPRHGVLSRLFRRIRLAVRIAAQDALAALYRAEEGRTASTLHRRTASSWINRLAHFQLRRAGDVEQAADGWRLTASGRAQARDLIRTHRLWEAFMSAELNLPADHVHDAADRIEHYTDPALSALLAAELEQPRFDPQGRPIPPAGG